MTDSKSIGDLRFAPQNSTVSLWAMPPTAHSPMCHVIFFGETGSGKSSVINLLLGVGDARVPNDSRPCTQPTSSTCYEASLYGRKYSLWDTRGLGEGRNFFQVIWGGGSEKDLKKFLKERHRKHEIDLLVYCVHGSRATKALVKIYNNFCTISRRLAAPVAIVVTCLEKEENTEDWWRRNASALSQLKMDFDEHACITVFPGPHQAESKEKLVNLITRNYRWKPKESGSYFGSPVQISTPSGPSQHGGRMIWNLFKSRYRNTINDGSLHPLQRNDSSPSTAVSSTKDSVYYSAESSTESAPPTPTVIPPTPRTTASISIESFPRSMFHTSPHSSHTSHSGSFTDGNEVFMNELLIDDLTAMVRRRKSFATQSGAFGDVWECDLLSDGSSRKVAVKAIKITLEEVESHRKRLQRGLSIWWRLRHRNVVPLLGVVSGFGHLPSMVVPWFSNRSLSIYLKVHPTLDTSERRHLLRDIAAGLCYLHGQDVIHGNLHSGNVLIDDNGTACLTDSGLSLFNEFVRSSFLAFSICDGMLFADPALIKQVYNSGDTSYPTQPCDIYSFGGLIMHVLSGRKPYDEIRSTSIFLTIMDEERPQIPDSVTPEYQSVIRSCWDNEEDKRPSADCLAMMLDQ